MYDQIQEERGHDGHIDEGLMAYIYDQIQKQRETGNHNIGTGAPDITHPRDNPFARPSFYQQNPFVLGNDGGSRRGSHISSNISSQRNSFRTLNTNTNG
jgi:hypothetical protein